MDRLTYWCDDGMGGGEYRANENGSEYSGPSIDRLAAYEDTGLEPAEIEIANKVIVSAFNLAANSGTDMLLERLKEIICAETEGRLLVLPCKVGDNVYQLEQALKSGAFRRFFVNGSIDIDALTADRLENLSERVQEEIDRCNIVGNQLVLKKVLEWIEEARHG